MQKPSHRNAMMELFSISHKKQIILFKIQGEEDGPIRGKIVNLNLGAEGCTELNIDRTA